MGETLSILFQKCEDGTFDVQARESWSGHTVHSKFVPPYTPKQLQSLHKKLNALTTRYEDLCEIGCHLFSALGGGEDKKKPHGNSVYAVLRSVIQRTLKRRGTVALTLCFGPDCDQFIRYPWELLHNGDHFLLASGIFTLTRAILRPDVPAGCELPVHPPCRVLYIGASPSDYPPLETERSFAALEQAFTPLIENGQVFLDRLEPPTFDQLVRYFNSYGGAGLIDDSDTIIPCYVVHFDGHGAYGRLCPDDACRAMNEADARKCQSCGISLTRVKAQTYLCFCDEDGRNQFVDTQSLRDLFLSSDVRLTVFAACETALVGEETEKQARQTVVDATLATGLVTAQVPAVVAMPFSLQDDLSPTFMFHFYEALADGRMLEEALSRARQAMMSKQHKNWFIPVLYRHVVEGDEGPVPLLVSRDAPGERFHPLEHLGASTTFIGRREELEKLDMLLTAIVSGEDSSELKRSLRLRSGTHHIALTGPAGIGKSALAFEAAQRNQKKFPGGIIGLSLQGGKTFNDALQEIIGALHIPTRISPATDAKQRARLALGALRGLASRELPCLLVLDGFEEVKDQAELLRWLQFLAALPSEIVVIITSRSNPDHALAFEGVQCRWYECPVGKMTNDDLLKLFGELASSSGLDQRIHLDDPRQQAILREICTLLDGYPLGAELIFGTARSIGGKIYTPEAATRSLEEVRDELRNTPLAGILAVLNVSYSRLTPLARLLLSYLSAFQLPFRREQIMLMVASEKLQAAKESQDGEKVSSAELLANWSAARDELVKASFIFFDGNVYTIHAQIRHFALSHLPLAERRRVHRVVADYYCQLPQPSPEEWFAAFAHLENAGEPRDIQDAVRVAVQASWALCGRGSAQELLTMLRRAALHASRLGDKTCEGRIQCCLGAVLRSLGQYSEAEAYLRSSLTFHRQQEDQENAGWALYELAVLAREAGNLQQAREHAEEALTLFRVKQQSNGEAWVAVVSGEISRSSGRYKEARTFFDQAQSIFRVLNNKEGLATVQRNYGTLFEVQTQYTQALNAYDEALRLFNELALLSGQAWVLADKSVLLSAQGDLEQAEKLANEALVLFRLLNQRRGEGWVLHLLGDSLCARQNLVQARTCYEQAREIFTALGDRINRAHVLTALAAVSLEEGDYLLAKELYEQAQAQAREQGARTVDERALRGLGDVARMMHRFVEAQRYYLSALSLAEELEIVVECCALLHRLGQLKMIEQDFSAALEYWMQALSLDRRRSHPARTALQTQVAALVAEHELQASYKGLSERYSLV
ncbi:MAG TPA: tetratricopeptide repeat protein [Ktedonobacteraceae bacterium]|nr:tetratricopeptide repeat protein [Ktedonobacteraceae bacterium]